MTKIELNEGLQVFEGAYPNRFVISETVLRIWFEVFKDIPGNVFNESVWDYIKSEVRVPTIAEIKQRCWDHMTSESYKEGNQKEIEEEPLSDEEWLRLSLEGKI